LSNAGIKTGLILPSKKIAFFAKKSPARNKLSRALSDASYKDVPHWLFGFSMKLAIIFIAAFLIFGAANAQKSKLPPCSGEYTIFFGKWTNCSGTLTSAATGTTYVGEFKDNGYHGYGTLTARDGSIYEGQWFNDKINGQGSLTFSDGGKYVGGFKDAKFHGKGRIYAPNGVLLKEGEWENDVYQALPIPAQIYRDQQPISPISMANAQKSKLPPCSGEYTIFFGKWTNCSGTLISAATGTTYVGEFKDNGYHGYGTLTARDGSIYEGQWFNDKTNGQGTLIFPNGGKYVGGFKDAKFHGKGRTYAPNGVLLKEGEWENDVFLEDDWRRAESEKKLLSDAFLNLKNSNSIWTEKVSLVVSNLLKIWLDGNSFDSLTEIPPPTFPLALNLIQDKWETNKEFEDRVLSSRANRQKEIERIQADYRERVNKRNVDVQRISKERTEKEKQLSAHKIELITKALKYINLQIVPKNSTLDPERGTLYIEASIDGDKVEKYEYKNAPPEIRREAITSIGSLKMTPEFYVTDSGQFGIKVIYIEAGGVKVAGNPAPIGSGSQAPRVATIDSPISNMPVLTQQSAIIVDRNQVDQILYRDENESLRKRLEDQRKSQEIALAEETKKASAEAARLRAESDALRQRQRELEFQIATTSRAPVNYGKALNAHALVIGNGAYSGGSRLTNPTNDARAMSKKLRGLGFVVTEAIDADRVTLVKALSEFSKSAVQADITLLFYAGHGVQITGTNYMLPVDLNLNDISQAPLQGISLNDVIEKYLPGKTKLVFLDSCRDNPLMQVASRGVSRGLAPINVSEGTLISYATKDGQVAQDGDGKNSPFTTALLEHLGDPDDIAVVLRKVREKVMKNTGNKQQPWEYGSLTGGALVLSAIKAQ